MRVNNSINMYAEPQFPSNASPDIYDFSSESLQYETQFSYDNNSTNVYNNVENDSLSMLNTYQNGCSLE